MRIQEDDMSISLNYDRSGGDQCFNLVVKIPVQKI